MNIVVMHFGTEQNAWIWNFIDSVRRTNPTAKLYQYTDLRTDARGDVDYVIRYNAGEEVTRERLGRTVINALAAYPLKEFVRLDADMLVTADISEVMDGDFDVGITNRVPGTSSPEFTSEHPYNGGFVVSKNPEFWVECKRRMDKMSYDTHNCLNVTKPYFEFLVGQLALCNTIDSGLFKVKFFDGGVYNYTPKDVLETNDYTKIWHFKGNRKYWLRNTA